MRFNDRSSEDTLVRLVTDGLLLAEIRHDRLLRRYDTIIVDEAHERSLNIDFLLGYLKGILPRRPDLKLIITSATIDPGRFGRHFGGAPVVEVSGRTYPVEVRYRPLAGPDDARRRRRRHRRRRPSATRSTRSATPSTSSWPRGPATSSSSSAASARSATPPRRCAGACASGDRRAAALRAAVQRRAAAGLPRRTPSAVSCWPPTSPRPRSPCPASATSWTRGRRAISRYSARLKVQRLPIEAISQASADQRKGRCGRTSDGICIRLYSEEDFERAPAGSPTPEVPRTNLASVLLQMVSLDLGDVESFGFPDPPDRRQVRDGIALLEELGAVEPGAARPARTPAARA